MTVPNEVLFDTNLDGLDKFIVGLIYTFPEISAADLQQFSQRTSNAEINNRLKHLTLLGYLEEEPVDYFKIKNLLILTYKSQKNQTFQDQEIVNRKKTRIIRRGSRAPATTSSELSICSVKNISKNNNDRQLNNRESSSLDEDSLDNQQKIEIEREKKYIPDMVQPFLDVWFESNLYIQGDATKGFAEDIESLKKLITGRFYSTASGRNVPFKYLDRSFSLDEWKLAVERFKKMAFDADYLPQKKEKLQKMRLNKFLYNEYSGYTGTIPNSMFLRLLVEPPMLKNNFNKRAETDHPKVTERLIHLFTTYRKEVLGNTSNKVSDEELDRLKLASRRIVQFFEDRKDKIWNYHNEFLGKNALADFTWAAILHDMEGTGIQLSAGYFCSNLTFEKRLPNFLKHKGYVK